MRIQLRHVWAVIARAPRSHVKTLGGLDTEASRLRSLEDENCRLKKLLAETMLDNSMLKDNATE